MIAAECCCQEPVGLCGTMQVSAAHRWGGFGSMPEWAIGTFTLSAGDNEAAYTYFMDRLSAVFGPLLGSEPKRWALWGDTYNFCSQKYTIKRCGWAATHIVDANEGAVPFSQEWLMEMDSVSGELKTGRGTSSGSTAFWSSLGLNGPENVGEFWTYDLNTGTGIATQEGTAFYGHNPTVDKPWSLTYLGALAYLAGSQSSFWPAGSSITMTISGTSATLRADIPAGGLSEDPPSDAVFTTAFVELLGGPTLNDAVEAAESLLDLLPLIEGHGPFVVYDGNVPASTTMQWSVGGGNENCVNRYYIETHLWPARIRINRIYAACDFGVTAERLLVSGAVTSLGYKTDIITVQKGRVRSSGLKCLTHGGSYLVTELVGNAYSCTFYPLENVCVSPTSVMVITPGSMLYYWGRSVLRQDCPEFYRCLNSCADVNPCDWRYLPPEITGLGPYDNPCI